MDQLATTSDLISVVTSPPIMFGQSFETFQLHFIKYESFLYLHISYWITDIFY